MPYTRAIGITLGLSQVGLTLRAQLVDTKAAEVGPPIPFGFAEIGAGNYLWLYESFPDGFRGGVKFFVGDQLMAFAAVNPPFDETPTRAPQPERTPLRASSPTTGPERPDQDAEPGRAGGTAEASGRPVARRGTAHLFRWPDMVRTSFACAVICVVGLYWFLVGLGTFVAFDPLPTAAALAAVIVLWLAHAFAAAWHPTGGPP